MAFPRVTCLWGRWDTRTSHLGQMEHVAETLQPSGRRGHWEPVTLTGPRSFPCVPQHSRERAWGEGEEAGAPRPSAWPAASPSLRREEGKL